MFYGLHILQASYPALMASSFVSIVMAEFLIVRQFAVWYFLPFALTQTFALLWENRRAVRSISAAQSTALVFFI